MNNLALDINITDPPSKEAVMYIVFNADLSMSKGKVAAQAGHAVAKIISCFEHSINYFSDGSTGFNLSEEEYYKYLDGSQTKIALKVQNTEELIKLKWEANRNDVYCELIQDEGRTQIEKGSYTVLGIEPLYKDHPFVVEYLSKLRLY